MRTDMNRKWLQYLRDGILAKRGGRHHIDPMGTCITPSRLQSNGQFGHFKYNMDT